MGRNRILTIVRTASVVAVVVAMAVQAVVLANNGAFDPTRFFAYFTIQSNLVGVAAFTLVLANRDRPRGRALESFRGAATSYLTVVFFVVIALLSNVDVGLQLAWVDFVLHKLFPLIVVLDWIIDRPTVRLNARDALAWLAYPLIWTGLTLLRGAADGWYPYPFLNPTNGGYAAVAITVVAITVGFLLVAAFYIWLGNLRGRLLEQPAT